MQKIAIDISYSGDTAEAHFFEVGVFRNGKISFEECTSFDVDSENSAWDAQVMAKNYVNHLIDELNLLPNNQ